MNLTAGYNADTARKYGINEALLLDTIVFWSRHSRRKDGFCWFTAEEFEVKTAIKSSAMKRAIDKLVKAGVIETKNTYVVGTQTKCRHFKIIKEPESEVAEMNTPDYTETAQSEVAETEQSVYISNRTHTELHLPKGKGETPVTYGNPDINELFDYWEQSVGYKIQAKIKPNRNACKNLIAKHGLEATKKLVDGAALASKDKYAPRIADFADLQAKLNSLMAWGKGKTSNSKHMRIG